MSGTDAEKTLTLWLSGLLDFSSEGYDSSSLPRLRGIETLLARGQRFKPPFEPWQYAFDVTEAHNKGLGRAALSAIGDGVQFPLDKLILRADPVYLRADKNGAMLYGGESLDISVEEANVFVQAFNQHFSAEGYELIQHTPYRWYLVVSQKWLISTTPLPEACGKSMHANLPRGVDAKACHTLINEVQMLFHGLEENDFRRQNGQAEINGIWLWGEGWLPDRVEAKVDRVYSNDPIMRGLSSLAEISCSEVPNAWSGIRDHHFQHALVVDDRTHAAQQFQDYWAWQSAASEWNENWFDALSGNMSVNHVDQVQGIFGKQVGVRASRGALNKFWRRPKPLLSYLSS